MSAILLPSANSVTEPCKLGASMVRYECERCRKRKQCFIGDEGGPLGVGLQERASNHLKLRGSRVCVVSVEEKAG